MDTISALACHKAHQQTVCQVDLLFKLTSTALILTGRPPGRIRFCNLNLADGMNAVVCASADIVCGFA